MCAWYPSLSIPLWLEDEGGWSQLYCLHSLLLLAQSRENRHDDGILGAGNDAHTRCRAAARTKGEIAGTFDCHLYSQRLWG